MGRPVDRPFVPRLYVTTWSQPCQIKPNSTVVLSRKTDVFGWNRKSNSNTCLSQRFFVSITLSPVGGVDVGRLVLANPSQRSILLPHPTPILSIGRSGSLATFTTVYFECITKAGRVPISTLVLRRASSSFLIILFGTSSSAALLDHIPLQFWVNPRELTDLTPWAS